MAHQLLLLDQLLMMQRGREEGRRTPPVKRRRSGRAEIGQDTIRVSPSSGVWWRGETIVYLVNKSKREEHPEDEHRGLKKAMNEIE